MKNPTLSVSSSARARPTRRPQCMRRMLPWLAMILLSGCASRYHDYSKDYRVQDMDARQARLALIVDFSQAPDYKPQTLEYGKEPRRVSYSGYPYVQVPFYQKGLDVGMGLTGLPYILPIPYPVPQVRRANSQINVFGERISAQQYRFLIPNKSQWNSGNTFTLNFANDSRRENITFRFSEKEVCPTRFEAITPTFGQRIAVDAQFQGKGGCIKVCDSRPQYPGYCAFSSL